MTSEKNEFPSLQGCWRPPTLYLSDFTTSQNTIQGYFNVVSHHRLKPIRSQTKRKMLAPVDIHLLGRQYLSSVLQSSYCLRVWPPVIKCMWRNSPCHPPGVRPYGQHFTFVSVRTSQQATAEMVNAVAFIAKGDRVSAGFAYVWLKTGILSLIVSNNEKNHYTIKRILQIQTFLFNS